MPYVKSQENFSRVNFLASADVQTFTYLVSNLGVTADAKGKKIVKAGTILPANNATAEGILYSDVDVTEGSQPGSLIVEGYILKDRLPVAPDATAIPVLTGIKLR